MECYCDARNKPMRCEITKPQTASVISLWFWGLLAYPELYCDWPEHNQHSRKFSGVHGFLSLTQNNRLRNQNISQSNRASGKSHLVLRHFVIFMSFIVFIGLNKASMRIDTTSLNFELLSPVTFNEVGDISSSIWKRVSLTGLFHTVTVSFGQAWKKLVFLAVVFNIVTQRSSKVEANQNTAFDKRIVSKQKHKRAKPFG